MWTSGAQWFTCLNRAKFTTFLPLSHTQALVGTFSSDSLVKGSKALTNVTVQQNGQFWYKAIKRGLQYVYSVK